MRTKLHQTYKIDGKIVPGCTTALGVLNKPALIGWAVKVTKQGLDHKLIAQHAADIGSLTHSMCEEELGGSVEVDFTNFNQKAINEARLCFQKFMKWKQDKDILVLALEKQLVSEKYQFGGTLDLFCTINNEGPFLIDFKTSSGMWEFEYQMAAYRQLLIENEFKVPTHCGVLRLPKGEEESFEEKYYTKAQLDKGWEVFKHCLEIYKLRRKRR